MRAVSSLRQHMADGQADMSHWESDVVQFMNLVSHVCMCYIQVSCYRKYRTGWGARLRYGMVRRCASAKKGNAGKNATPTARKNQHS